MRLKYNILYVKVICLAGLFLLLLTSSAFAQRAEITIRCDSDPEAPKTPVKTEDENPKNKKTKIKISEDISPRLKLNVKSEKSAIQENLTGQAGIIPINCTALAQITVHTGPSNTTVNLTVTQMNSANILSMSLTAQGSYGSVVIVPVQLNSSGQGVSSPFYIRGVIVGETTLNASGSGTYTNPLDIIVVECKCPIIPVNTPPRN